MALHGYPTSSPCPIPLLLPLLVGTLGHASHRHRRHLPILMDLLKLIYSILLLPHNAETVDDDDDHYDDDDDVACVLGMMINLTSCKPFLFHCM